MGSFIESVYDDVWKEAVPKDGGWLLDLHGGLLGRHIRAVEDVLVAAAYKADRGNVWGREDWSRTDVEHYCKVWNFKGREPVATVEIWVTRQFDGFVTKRERVAWTGFRKCLAEDEAKCNALAYILHSELLSEIIVSAGRECGALYDVVRDIQRVLSYRVIREGGSGDIISPTWVEYDVAGDLAHHDAGAETEDGKWPEDDPAGKARRRAAWIAGEVRGRLERLCGMLGEIHGKAIAAEVMCDGEKVRVTVGEGKGIRKPFFEDTYTVEGHDDPSECVGRICGDVERGVNGIEDLFHGGEAKGGTPEPEGSPAGNGGPVLDTDNIPPQEVYDRVEEVTHEVHEKARKFHMWLLDGPERERVMLMSSDVCTTAEGRVLVKAWEYGKEPFYSKTWFVETFADKHAKAQEIFVAFRDAVCAHYGLDPRGHVLHVLEGRGDCDCDWSGVKLLELKSLVSEEASRFGGWLEGKCQELQPVRAIFTKRPYYEVALVLRRGDGTIVCLHISDTRDGLTAEEAAERITSEFGRKVCEELGLSYVEYEGYKRRPDEAD